jgi:hypothetical protein
MNLVLRKVIHDQARNNWRVILDDEDGEVEVGSIGIQNTTGMNSAWHWGIDTVIPMRSFESEGHGKDLKDCMRRFRTAWDRFSADEANLTAFLQLKRAASRSRQR